MTKEEALAWIAEMFEESPEDIRPESPRDEIAGWDSLGVLTLMAGLDERFDIRLTESELGDMTTVEDILAVLRANNALTEG